MNYEEWKESRLTTAKGLSWFSLFSPDPMFDDLNILDYQQVRGMKRYATAPIELIDGRVCEMLIYDFYTIKELLDFLKNNSDDFVLQQCGFSNSIPNDDINISKGLFVKGALFSQSKDYDINSDPSLVFLSDI
jgi:hypothetical protein